MEELSVIGSMLEPGNEIYLTGEMFCNLCCLFAILYGWVYFEGPADELWPGGYKA